MRYKVRRIGLGSVARLGCLLSGLVALPPGLCLAGLSVVLVQRIDQTLQQIRPLTFSVLGQEVLRIDLLDAMHLRSLADGAAGLTRDLSLTFGRLTLALVLTGGALLTVTALLITVAYNLVARAGGGVSVELSDEPRPRAAR